MEKYSNIWPVIYFLGNCYTCSVFLTVTMLDHVDVDKAHTEDLIWGWKKTLARCHTSAMDTQNSVCF